MVNQCDQKLLMGGLGVENCGRLTYKLQKSKPGPYNYLGPGYCDPFKFSLGFWALAICIFSRIFQLVPVLFPAPFGFVQPSEKVLPLTFSNAPEKSCWKDAKWTKMDLQYHYGAQTKATKMHPKGSRNDQGTSKKEPCGKVSIFDASRGGARVLHTRPFQEPFWWGIWKKNTIKNRCNTRCRNNMKF